MMKQTDDRTTEPTVANEGFTLIELLIVIVILGILSTIVVFAVRGVREEANATGCAADARTLETSIEGYFALAPAILVPGTDDPDDRELALVGLGLLRAPSELYEVTDQGELALGINSPCTL